MNRQYVGRKTKCFLALITIIFAIMIFLAACGSSTIWLYDTPEHCYVGTPILTVDYISDYVYSAEEVSADKYIYYSDFASKTVGSFISYLDGVGYKRIEARGAGDHWFDATYETPYGKIIISCSSYSDMTVAGKVELSFQRSHPSDELSNTIPTEVTVEEKYADAVELYEQGDYVQAIELFDQLGNYEQSAVLEETAKQKLLQNATIGDIVVFGQYEQNNVISDGSEPICWMVLNQDNGRLLLISQKVLDRKPFDESDATNLWKDCSLRRWCNNTFYDSAFSAVEQSAIQITVVNSYSEKSWLPVESNDKIFILSDVDVDTFSLSREDLKAKPTEYVIAQGNGGNIWTSWWLRPMQDFPQIPNYVSTDGTISALLKTSDSFGFDRDYGVRPVMWIDVVAYEEAAKGE